MRDGSRTNDKQQATAVDLFAGAGGLTVGLKRAGFSVLSAVELNYSAAQTYKANHPEVDMTQKDIRSLKDNEIDGLGKGQSVDLVAGCPPCQGFTSLTSKWRREDERNSLVQDMAKIVIKLTPRVVMMENVPGLGSVNNEQLRVFRQTLESSGYIITHAVLQTADFGTPQSRKRFVLFAGRGFKIDMPHPTHTRDVQRSRPSWVTVRDVLEKIDTPRNPKRNYPVAGSHLNEWNVVRDISALNMQRIQYARPGGDWRTIPVELRPKCHQSGYFGFRNVYGRMEWDKPSPTITSGCTTPSKGRFGHPDEDRTISVLEAAMLQQFPEDYKIMTNKIDEVCSLIGNALPCGFAAAMAEKAMEYID